MHVAIDAHAIGRQLTGNEVYIRNLLGALARKNGGRLTAYVSSSSAGRSLPGGVRFRQVSSNALVRLGVDIPRLIRRDKPNVLHVQYTAPEYGDSPVVASVHDVSFLEHPEYFRLGRSIELRHTG